MEKLRGTWSTNSDGVQGVSYLCGFCDSNVGPSRRYKCNYQDSKLRTLSSGNIYICPNCNKPTFISGNEQVPGQSFGDRIEFLPKDIEALYSEAKNCISINAYTSTVLSCRKLLMNVSVSKGAVEGKSFAFYVTYLEENHYIPPNSRDWVDHIRKKGNEATHEIPSISKEEAIELLEFTGMLLRFVYEMPGKMNKYATV